MFFSFPCHQGPSDGSGRTCVEELIFGEADAASFSPDSPGEAEAELCRRCGDAASLLSSLKL